MANTRTDSPSSALVGTPAAAAVSLSKKVFYAGFVKSRHRSAEISKEP